MDEKEDEENVAVQPIRQRAGPGKFPVSRPSFHQNASKVLTSDIVDENVMRREKYQWQISYLLCLMRPRKS